MQVDAVEQRPRQPALVFGRAAQIGPAFAGESGVAGAPAAARIHRRHQHETRRIGDAVIDARDRDLAGFQRLAQRVENLGGEFRHLVEEQDAVMRQRNFARPRPQAAADQRRHRRRVMRRPERPLVGQRAAFDHAGDRGDHRDFEQFGRRQRRQDRRQPCRQHRLAGAGRPDHHQVMAAGGGDFERALGALLALDVGKVERHAVDLADLRDAAATAPACP